MNVRLPILTLSLASLAGVGLVPTALQDGDAPDLLAVRAGTIHLVEDGRVLEDGVLLIEDGRIQAVGTDLDVPAHAQVVDYGPDAVIVPGLVAAWSPYALGVPGDRTADPTLSALDGYDSYRVHSDGLSGGVTSAYIVPAESRLIAGTGAVVKLGGERDTARVVNPAAAIHGTIDQSARSTPGYWEPPVPVMVEVELGYERPQLPRTTMGAIVALEELVDGARSRDADLAEEYGRRTLEGLAAALEADVPLRIGAIEESEIRALLQFAGRGGSNLILDRAHHAGDLAAEIAAAGIPVVYRLPWSANLDAADLGKGEDARWRELDVPARLVAAGARVAVTGDSPRDLLFAARLASRGGLDPQAALRAVTLTPAEILGVAREVGSLAVGKDADLCVLNGAPLDPGTSVLATWIDGELVWKAHDERQATVLEVDELHVGDGRVLRPGQLLMLGGRIVEVGERVSHPRGAVVVRGRAAMPGMIDAFGHLGLEGSRKVPSTGFELASIVAPGDEVDRRVALEGITTVVMTPRGASDSGAPVMAYKPAASDHDRQVLGDPVALRLSWDDNNRLRSGEKVKALLQKAVEYRAEWSEYERAMAAWEPPPPGADEEKADEADEKADEAEAEAADEDEGKEEDDKKSRRKRKKDEPEELEPDPVTGLWEATVEAPEGPAKLRIRAKLATPGESSAVEGNLRCDAVSTTLVEVEGWLDREARTLNLRGLGSRGWVELAGELKEGKLEAALRSGSDELPATLERTSLEYPVARRTQRLPEEPEKEKDPKGKPKEPKLDEKLEPLRRALEGEATIVVEVERAGDIERCVDAFEAVGIRPILYGASEAHLVVDELVDRIAGVLLRPMVVLSEAKRGSDYRTPYSDLQNAGIRVAFQSEAEEGAIDLPLRAAYAVANGMSPEGALRALTADAAAMMSIDERVGRLERGLDADVLLLDGAPLDPGTSVLRAWVNGEEVEAR